MLSLFLGASALGAASVALAGMSARLGRGTDQRLQQRAKVPALSAELPWWHIDDHGVIVGVDGTTSLLFSMVGVDVDCLSDEELDEVERQLHALLVSLPAGVRLQFGHETDHDHRPTLARYESGVTSTLPIAHTLMRARRRAIAKAPRLRRTRLTLGLSLPPKRSSGRRSVRHADLTEEAYESACSTLDQLERQMRSALRSASIEIHRLDADEVRAHCYAALNPSRAAVVPAPPSEGLPGADATSVREALCLSDLLEERDLLLLDGRLIRVLTVTQLPMTTDPAMLEGLTVALPFACRVQVSLQLTDDQGALDRLKRKRDRALIHLEGRKRNHEAEAATRDLEDLIAQTLASSLRMVRLGVAVVLSVDASRPDAKETLEAQSAEVVRIFSTLHGTQATIETFAQLDAWLATLPVNSHHRERAHVCTSKNAAHLALHTQAWPGHDKAPLLLEDARNHLLCLDPFDPNLDNPNAFVAGTSGSGKSVTTNYLLMHLFGAGAKGLIVDIGGSYRRLIELYGGANLSVGDPDAALNLFCEPNDMLLPSGEPNPMRLRVVLAVLESLLTDAESPRLRHEDLALLEGTIARLYRHATRAPLLSDLEHCLRDSAFPEVEDQIIARRFVRALARWTQGAHARLLNRPSTIRLGGTLTGMDLKGLPDEVQAPALLILSGLVWDLMTEEPETPKVVVFDEVWKLLKRPAGCALIEELYRTSRKYRTSVMSLSQSVADFVDSPIASALINTSATTYLLRHRTGHARVAGVLGLNDRELALFRDLEMRRGEFSELLLLSGDRHHVVARVVLSPLEYWIATTHPADLAFLADIEAAHPSWSLLMVLQECARLAPQGVEASGLSGTALADDTLPDRRVSLVAAQGPAPGGRLS